VSSKVGIVGGTFDPIHLGHIALAEGARDCAKLDRVLLIPAADPPHRGGAVASPQQRLEMSRLAVQEHPGLEVSDLELRRPGPSYTVDTLHELTGRLGGAELYMVLGWDAARELRSWREPDEVLRLARLLVVPRPGWDTPALERLEELGNGRDRIQLCPITTPEVDATRLRELAAEGASLSGLVAPAVERYIREHGLYRHPG
jgi:nicotinate-nucleotide adenylyltransferase